MTFAVMQSLEKRKAATYLQVEGWMDDRMIKLFLFILDHYFASYQSVSHLIVLHYFSIFHIPMENNVFLKIVLNHNELKDSITSYFTSLCRIML